MLFDDAISIRKPEPDSQFRLRPCMKCKGDNAAYVEYKRGSQELWRVQCFDCGHTVDRQAVLRHEAQEHWNKEVAYELYKNTASITAGPVGDAGKGKLQLGVV